MTDRFTPGTMTDRSQRSAICWLRILIPIALLALQGCSGLTTRPATSGQAFAHNRELSHWQLSGKIGIRSPRGADSAYLNWLQCGERYQIRINGPLGSGAVKLLGEPGLVTLLNGGEPTIVAASPEQLLMEQFGWQLPLSQLVYWVRGIPAPQQPWGPEPLGFEQDGWQLSFPSQTEQQHYQLPAKAVAQQQQQELKVILIVKEWQLLPDCEGLQ